MSDQETLSERVRLDEILKSLFSVSSTVLVNMLNSLFQEKYAPEATEVSFASNEFVDDEYNILRGDLFLKLSDEAKSNHYHIELQTLNDDSMVIRMLEYGIGKAKELAKYEGNQEETIFYIPRQLVIFIEQNPRIRDELRLRLVFPDGQEVGYRVPVMKYWEYTREDLLAQKLYPLLPLQVFRLRWQMEKIKRRKSHTEKELRDRIQEAKRIVENISREAVRLFHVKEIDGDDLHKILLANEGLFRYLNSKYVKDEQLNEEVLSMTRTLYDPVAVEKAKKEGKLEGQLEGKLEVARKLIQKKMTLDEIKEITDLSEAEIEKIIKQLEN